jgi:hypothetical protein
MRKQRIVHYVTAITALVLAGEVLVLASEAGEQAAITIRWAQVVRVSKTVPTLQVVVNPLLRRGSKTHDRVFQAIQDLGCEYVRYVPWLPYPKLGVAELKPPHEGMASWDFSLIDPMTEDFMNATRGHSVIVNFSTMRSLLASAST